MIKIFLLMYTFILLYVSATGSGNDRLEECIKFL